MCTASGMLVQALKFNPQAAALVRQSLQGGFPEKFANLTQLKHLAIHRAGKPPAPVA